MSRRSLEAVMVGLRLLSKTEREELAGRLAVLDGRGSGVAEEVYGVVSQAVGGKGFPPLSVLARSPQYRRFVNGAGTLDRFVAEVFGPLRRVVRRKVLLLLVRCVLADMKERRIPLGAFAIGDGMGRVWDAVTGQYPGYLESGCLTDALVDGGVEWTS